MTAVLDVVGGPRNYGPDSQELEEEQRRKAEEALRREEQEKEEQERREAEEAQHRAANWEHWVSTGRRRRRRRRRRGCYLPLQALGNITSVHVCQTQSLEEARRQEEEVLEAQSAPMRSYLMEHVVPTLTRGLMECCTTRPQDQDPVDFLVLPSAWPASSWSSWSSWS